MEHRYKSVVFDLDGTLLYTLEDIADSVNAALRHFGYPERSLEHVRNSVGNGGRVLIGKSLPENTPEEKLEEVLAWYEPYYETHCEIKTGPYPGVMELLEELRTRGIGMAIVSNKGDGAVRALAKRHFGESIPFAVGERKGIRRKPWPDSVLEAMRMLGCSRDEVLYVGDSEVDHATAEAAGIPVALVNWGYRDEEILRSLHPEHMIDTTKQLLDLF